MLENEEVTEELLRLYEERKKCRHPHFQCPNGCNSIDFEGVTLDSEYGQLLTNRSHAQDEQPQKPRRYHAAFVYVDEWTSEHYYVCTCSECNKQWLESKADLREKQERIDQRIAELEMANQPKEEKTPRKVKVKHWFKENGFLLFTMSLAACLAAVGIGAIISIL
ncbi:MAG: hypothetical protein NC132_01515 [Corallococcus sp.]|nr:hypothetical protein [Corallococcus sp.]MCM1359336.1 hypothetical protein [Corallococcus sp.]MCM1394779.1 hypothetical protein [Corallococcus sp.]